MKVITLTLVFGLLGYSISNPLDAKDDTEPLVEIEKQKLIKFPEDLDRPNVTEANEKHDEAQRILQEIEKINRALGYVKKQADQSRSPTILDSSQYLFPNTGYQPYHVQNAPLMGANGETLLLPSIRSVNFEPSHYNKASDFNVPPTKKSQKQKGTPAQNSLYFNPNRVEFSEYQTEEGEKLLPTHFLIPVRLYKRNKQQYVEKQHPQEYKMKGYKIVGDIDHFYAKTKANKTSSGTTIISLPKYHLFILPDEVVSKNSFKDTANTDESSKESSSREEKLAHRPYKVQTNTQTVTNGNTVNSTSTAQIIKKRIVPKKGAIVSASSSTVVKVQPPNTNSNGQQQTQSQQQHTQQQQQQQQQHFQKPMAAQQMTQMAQPAEVSVSSFATSSNQAAKPNINNKNPITKNPLRPLLNLVNNNKNSNTAMKTRPLLELQNNINSINNATTNAIKTAFQNIFRLPFRQPEATKPLTATEFTTMDNGMPLPMAQQQQQQQQQQYYTSSLNGLNTPQAPQQMFYGDEHFSNDHLDSDYKWDDENGNMDGSSADYQENISNFHESTVPEEKKVFSHLLKHKHEIQKDALKQGGIIIQKLKVRKGGIAIAGPGGVATAGSGGTAIVGPGGYALTHPRSLTIAGPGAKIIAIPSSVDLKDALQRTNLDLQTFPREGRIVATGPTVYYAPPTGDYIEF